MGSSSRPYIGGQAVLEGVMMRAPKSFAVVVRRRDGSLVVRERGVQAEVKGLSRLPLVRGVVSVVESLKLGSEALRFSADEMQKDLSTHDGQVPAGRGAGSGLGVLGAVGLSLFALLTRDARDEGPSERRPGGQSLGGGRVRDRAAGWVMLAVALAFFVAAPQAAAAACSRALGLELEVQSAAFQAITGAWKLVIVVGYLLAIRRMPEIRRVFQYHGAEHKTISTYEAGDTLSVAAARPRTTLHPRCGTTFLVMVALVSIVVFTGIGAALPRIRTGSVLLDNGAFFFEKLPFLPIIAAIAFELQRVLARHCASGPLRVLLWPGFLVQKITTAEPEDAQLEVALASLRVTLFREEAGQQAGPPICAGEEDVAFPSYEALLSAGRLRAAA